MSSDSEEEVIYNAFDAYLNIGRHLLRKKQYKRALFYLDIAQNLDDRSVPCLQLRATCYLYMTKMEQAILVGKKALALNPHSPHTLLLIAEAYYRKGEFEEALVYFANGQHIRPSISEFQKGIYKCEAAIENNCGDYCDIRLAPDMDLTDYYMHAFPPKLSRGASTKKPPKNAMPEKKSETWPIHMSPRILNKIFGKEYPEYVYLKELYSVEGKRAAFLKQTGTKFIYDVLPRIRRCEDNRDEVMECANCLSRKCDLWYKVDPSLSHIKSTQ